MLCMGKRRERVMRHVGRLVVAAVCAACLASSGAAQFRPDPVRQARTQSDYRATLQRLGIEVMREGADGFNKSSPNYVNYDEAKAGTPSPPPPIHVARPPTP